MAFFFFFFRNTIAFPHLPSPEQMDDVMLRSCVTLLSRIAHHWVDKEVPLRDLSWPLGHVKDPAWTLVLLLKIGGTMVLWK